MICPLKSSVHWGEVSLYLVMCRIFYTKLTTLYIYQDSRKPKILYDCRKLCKISYYVKCLLMRSYFLQYLALCWLGFFRKLPAIYVDKKKLCKISRDGLTRIGLKEIRHIFSKLTSNYDFFE